MWGSEVQDGMSEGQSKKASAVEVTVNMVVGYIIAVTAQHFIFPLFGIYVSVSDNLMIGGLFTVVSILRSYFLRRLFNWCTVFVNQSKRD